MKEALGAEHVDLSVPSFSCDLLHQARVEAVFDRADAFDRVGESKRWTRGTCVWFELRSEP
jgi:hypothetical protein